MAAALGLGVVFERGPVVEDPAVIDEVHLAGLEGELGPQRGAVQHLVEPVERLALGGGQGLAGLLVPGLDPVAEVTEERLGPPAAR